MKRQDNRLEKAFAELRSAGKKTVVPFITAGYPDLATTELMLAEFATRGARVCELGIPFSDPIADGPVIQASYTDALARGITSAQIFEMVRRYRHSAPAFANLSAEASAKAEATAGKLRTSHSALALVAMVSYSIVYHHGVKAYLAEAAGAGFDGLIVPDLPLEEAGGFEKLARAAGLCNVMLIAPTTPPPRRLEIARHSRGFVYYISIAGITGERVRLPQATIAGVEELRRGVQTPVCVGFGISNARTVAEVCHVADGAIVGSAIVKRITEAGREGLSGAALARRVGDFVSELLTPL